MRHIAVIRLFGLFCVSHSGATLEKTKKYEITEETKLSTKNKSGEAMPSVGVRLRQNQIDECDRLYQKLGLESRNDFIRDAIDFYCEYLRCPESVKFLTPALESVITAKIRDTESRLRDIMFKNAVQLAKLSNIMMYHYDYSDEDMENMREDAVRDVLEANGKYRY